MQADALEGPRRWTKRGSETECGKKLRSWGRKDHLKREQAQRHKHLLGSKREGRNKKGSNTPGGKKFSPSSLFLTKKGSPGRGKQKLLEYIYSST